MGAINLGSLDSTALHRDISAAATLAGGRLSSLVILVSTTLRFAEPRILAACRAAMAYTSRALIACAVSEAAHHDEAPSQYSPTCYADFCSAAWHQLQPRATFDIMVKCCPILTIPLGDLAFVLPAASAASTAATSSGRPLGYVPIVHTAADSDDDEEAIPGRHSQQGIEKSHGVAVLAHALASIAAALGVRPEAFCLGPAAVAVGKSLSFVASSDAAPAAFILVDRGVDLAAPLHHADILMERSWDLLRSAAEEGNGWDDKEQVGSHNDWGFNPPVHVPIAMPSPAPSATTSEKNGHSQSAKESFKISPSFLPGSLFHPSDPQTTSQLGFLLTRPGKDAAMFVRKWLREAARKEGVPAATLPRSRPGAVGAAELRALASALAAFPAVAQRTSPLLQLAEAAAAALEEGPAATWDALSREEKILYDLMEHDEGPEHACEQLVDLLATAARGGLVDLPQAVGLMIIAYQILPEHLPWYASRGGAHGIAPFAPEHEARLRGALSDAVLACSARWSTAAEPEIAAQRDAPWLPQPLLERLAAGEGAVEDAGQRRAVHLEVKDAAGEVLARLRELSQLRQTAKGRKPRSSSGVGGGPGEDEEYAYSESRPADGSSRPSVLLRLAGAVADRAEIPGLKHASTSLAGLLKSGLGRFGLQRQPRPGEYPVVVIFVIGGVSLGEIHDVLSCVDAKAVAAGAAAAAQPAGNSGLGDGGVSVRMPPPKVIVGGTVLLQPREVVARALART